MKKITCLLMIVLFSIAAGAKSGAIEKNTSNSNVVSTSANPVLNFYKIASTSKAKNKFKAIKKHSAIARRKNEKATRGFLPFDTFGFNPLMSFRGNAPPSKQETNTQNYFPILHDPVYDLLNGVALQKNANFTTVAAACDSYIWTVNNETYTQSGIYTFDDNVNIHTLELTITQSSENTTTISKCNNYYWANTGIDYSLSGTYYGTTTNCVTEKLVLTITPVTENVTSVSACDSYYYADNDETYTTSGTYYGSTNNCVVQVLNLTITPSSQNITSATACDSYFWINNGQTYTTSGTYTGNTDNCVTDKLVLSITPNSDNVTNITAPDTYTWANNNTTYTTSGIYTGNTTDCVTEKLNLTIIPSNTTTQTACASYFWAVSGDTYTQSGTYSQIVNNVNEVLNLTIIPLTENITNITANNSYTWNGTTYTTSGLYSGTTSNCTVDKLNLTINGAALDFDGINDRASIANNSSLNVNQFTIETWLKWDNSSTVPVPFICSNGIENKEIHITKSNNSLRFIPIPGLYVDTNANTLTPNTWTHVACVFNPATSLAKIYFNGVEMATTISGPTAITTAVGNSTANFVLGSRIDTSFPYKGALDEFRIWNKALTQAEIVERYNCEIPTTASGLIANLHFNQGTAGLSNTAITAITDVSGSNNNATLTNFDLTGATSNFIATGGVVSNTTCTNFLAAALDFDGTNDYATIANNNNFNVNQFTIETWLKWDSSSSVVVPFITSKGFENMEIHINKTTKSVRFIPTTGVFIDTDANSLPENTWVHVACVYNPNASLAKIYINGIEMNATNAGANPLSSPVVNNAVPLYLGSRGVAVFPFKGAFDEFRVWNRALTQAEIQGRMNCEIPTTACGLITNLHFNQGVAGASNTAIIALTDSSGFSNNAALTNFDLTGISSNFIATGGVVSYTVCNNILTAAPTANATQTFCGNATIASLTATGTNLLWYANPTGGTALATTTTLTNNTTYYVSQTANGCESARTAINVAINTRPPAPTAPELQILCSGSTIADLAVTGSNLLWYANNSGGSPISTSTTLANAFNYFVTQTINGCESESRTWINVALNTTPAPTATTLQILCAGSTIADLTVTGSNLRWYNSFSGGSPISTSTTLANAFNYFVTQMVNGCESARTAINVAINTRPTAPTATATQNICGSGTIANLTATGTNIKWYAAQTGGTALATTTALVNNTTYYASQTVNGCESASRTAVTTTITPTTDNVTTISSCGSYTWENNNQTYTTTGVYSGTTTNCVTEKLNLTIINAVPPTNFTVNGINYVVTGTNTVAVDVTPTASGAVMLPATVSSICKTYTVTSIGESAFTDCAGLTSITIPNTVTSIGTFAFNGCTGLTSITIPNSVNSIGEFAFQSCTALTSVTIPNSITSIAGSTFNFCTSLASVTLPSSITSIGNFAFNNCTSLSSITIPNSVTSIEDQVFQNCSSLISVTVSWATPLNINFTSAFAGINASATLIVPPGTVAAYDAAQEWTNFFNIIENCSTVTYNETTVTACGSYTWASNGQTYTTTGVYTTPTINCVADKLNLTINAIPSAPTATAQQIICGSGTIANLTATGTNIKWYATATGGTSLATATALVNATTYYASQSAAGGCESASRTAVTTTIAPPKNIVLSPTTFCSTDATKTITSIVSETPIETLGLTGDIASSNWTVQTGTLGNQSLTNEFFQFNSGLDPQFQNQTASVSITLPYNATIIFTWIIIPGDIEIGTYRANAFVMVNGVATTFAPLTGNVNAGTYTVTIPANQPFSINLQTFSNGTGFSFTAQDFVLTQLPTISGSGTFNWSASNGGSIVGSNTNSTVNIGTSGTYQLAYTSATGCVTTNSVATTVVTSPLPTAAANQTFCGIPTVAILTASGTNIKWYDASTGGTPLAASTALTTATTYYVSQTVNNCESERVAVAVTLVPIPTTPTVATTQVFCTSGVTIANLVATGTDIKWFANATSSAPLLATATLTTATTYYVSQTINGCESARVPVMVEINDLQVNAGADVTLCASNNSTLNATVPSNTNGVIATGFTGTYALPNWTFTGANADSFVDTTSIPNSFTINAIFTANLDGPLNNSFALQVPETVTISFDWIFSSTTFITNLNTSTGTFIPNFFNSPMYSIGNGMAIPLNGFALASGLNQSGTQTLTVPAGTLLSIFTNTIQTVGNTTLRISNFKVRGAGSLTSSNWTASNGGSFSGDASSLQITPLTTGTYTFSGTSNNGCSASDSVDVVVNTTPLPITTATQSFCVSGTVANLTATGTDIKWYATATGGTALASTETLATATYYVSQTVDGCESLRAAVGVSINPIPAAPIANPNQSFCDNAIFGNLTATGTNLRWYVDTTSTFPYGPTDFISGDNTFYVSQTVNGCESERTEVNVTVYPIPDAPIAAASQTVCSGSTLANLSATGDGLLWYAAATGGTPLATTTALTNNTTYYVSQTFVICESARTAVAVTVNPIPAAPIADTNPFICGGGTLADIVVTGSNLKWYEEETGGTELVATTVLVHDTFYYVTQTIDGCESERFGIEVSTEVEAPEANYTQTFCNNSTITNLTATGTNLKWYATATGGTPLAPNTALTNNTTYYVSQTVEGCESARTAVTVTTNSIIPMPGALTSVLDQSSTADLTNIVFQYSDSPVNSQSFTTSISGLLTRITVLHNNPNANLPEQSTQFFLKVYSGVGSDQQQLIGFSSYLSTTRTSTVDYDFTGIPVVQGQQYTFELLTENPTPHNQYVLYTLANEYAGGSYLQGYENQDMYFKTFVQPNPKVYLCNNNTVGNITITGTNVKWYESEFGGAALETTATVTNNTTYYATQTINGCESARSAVTVIINPIPAAPIANGSQTICGGGTLADIVVTGTNLKWYDADIGGVELLATTALVGGSLYFVTQTIDGCESERLSIEISTEVEAPEPNDTQTFCSSATIADLTTFNGDNLKWYSTATGGTALASTVTLSTANYYVSQTYKGCESLRTAVTVIVNTTTWNGSIWSNGPPTASKGVVISGNFTASTNLSACSLTVTGNADVNVPSGFNFTIEGKVTVASTASLAFENNANLIQVSNVQNEGNIVVKRNSAALMRLDYTLWSSPVLGQQLQSFSSATLADRFYSYNAATDKYNAQVPTANFVTGKGYLIRMPNNHPTTPTLWNGSFAGIPNNGNITVEVATSTFNAIGNPYPSTIDADAFINANALTEPLYFWTKTNNAASASYATYTLAGGTANAGGLSAIVPNGTIQVGQGFIAKSTSNAFVFTNALRTGNNNNQFLKTKAVEKHRVWLNLYKDNAPINQMLIAYLNGATNGIDSALDGRFFNDSQVALNSIINNEEFVIQAKGLPFDDNDVVPLTFKTNTDGNYTISIGQVEGQFAGNQDVYLNDKTTGTYHNLKNSKYRFTASAGTFNDRFELVYKSSRTLGINESEFTNSVVVFKQNGVWNINSGSKSMKTVRVFDIQGRLIFKQENINKNNTVLKGFVAAEQTVLVQITVDDRTVTKKVVF